MKPDSRPISRRGRSGARRFVINQRGPKIMDAIDRALLFAFAALALLVAIDVSIVL